MVVAVALVMSGIWVSGYLDKRECMCVCVCHEKLSIIYPHAAVRSTCCLLRLWLLWPRGE